MIVDLLFAHWAHGVPELGCVLLPASVALMHHETVRHASRGSQKAHTDELVEDESAWAKVRNSRCSAPKNCSPRYASSLSYSIPNESFLAVALSAPENSKIETARTNKALAIPAAEELPDRLELMSPTAFSGLELRSSTFPHCDRHHTREALRAAKRRPVTFLCGAFQ